MLYEKITIERSDGYKYQDLLINFVLSFGKRPRNRFIYSVRMDFLAQSHNRCEVDRNPHYYGGPVSEFFYTMRDFHGKKIDPAYVIHLLSDSKKHSHLVEPITHRFSMSRKRRRYRVYRRPRTTQERRWAVVVDELEPHIRGARKPSSIPDCYDDIARNLETGWKACRKTRHQYK